VQLTALQKRLASAGVLLPAIIAVVVVGHPAFGIVIAVCVAIMIWEWVNVCAGKNIALRAGTIGAALAAAIILAKTLGAIDTIGALALMTAGSIALAALALPKDKEQAAWLGAGMVYVLLPALALMALREDRAQGTGLVLWVLGLTVAADTMAYVAGRSIGGPKLAPRISPNKTWAGLGGAVLGAGAAGAVASPWLSPGNLWELTILSAVLGIVEQVGDLVESAFKRHFGVKDSGRIIPGHGGVLDRVDGLLAVAVAVAAINELGGAQFLHGGQ
jgi:phosphatidate cytidylyltransferase